MPEDRIRVAPNTVAYADRESHKLGRVDGFDQDESADECEE